MSIGKIVIWGGGGILLGLIAGFVTRNIFVGFAFPFLLIAFYLIWDAFKRDLAAGNIQPEVEEKPVAEETEQTENTSDTPSQGV